MMPGLFCDFITFLCMENGKAVQFLKPDGPVSVPLRLL